MDFLVCPYFQQDGRIQRVEYEALPTVCFGCGKYGHTSSSCQDKMIHSRSKGKSVTHNKNATTSEPTIIKATRETHYISASVPSSSNQFHTISMQKDTSRTKNKSTMTKLPEPSLIPTSLDPNYHYVVSFYNNSANETI